MNTPNPTQAPDMAVEAMPKMPPHPEPHSMTWSRLELETINDYGRRCFEAGRATLARPQEVAGVTAKINEAREILDETYSFATTSPRSQENINAVSSLLDEIESASRAPVAVGAEPVPMIGVSSGMLRADVFAERLACSQVAEDFMKEHPPGPHWYAANTISARILGRSRDPANLSPALPQVHQRNVKEATPSPGAGGSVGAEPYMPSYGRFPWDVLRDAVAEATVGSGRADVDPDTHIGHQIVTLNYNSLNRIVSKFSTPAPSVPLGGGETPKAALKDLMRGYVNLLETMCDRIKNEGGQCDSVDQMEATDPYLRAARSALQAQDAAPVGVVEPRKATYRKTKKGIILVADPDSWREQQWKFVPLNPTREMMEGAFDNISLSDAHSPFGVEEHVWDFMLSRAPEPPNEDDAAPVPAGVQGDAALLAAVKEFASRVVRFGETSDEGMFRLPSSQDAPAMTEDHLNVQFMVRGNFGTADALFDAMRPVIASHGGKGGE